MISADFYLSSVLLFKCSISGTIGDETILVVMLPAASGALLVLETWMAGEGFTCPQQGWREGHWKEGWWEGHCGYFPQGHQRWMCPQNTV